MTRNEVDVRKLKENEVVFIKGSNLHETRFYRYNRNSDSLEYTEDKINWKASKLDIEYLNSLELVVE